jgi:hypothetical protein
MLSLCRYEAMSQRASSGGEAAIVGYTNTRSCILGAVTALYEDKIRYLVHFAEGGSGLRWRHDPLEEGTLITEGEIEYVVLVVEHPISPDSFGHAWVELA